MLRISKLTDYGTVVLAELVDRGQRVTSAGDVAEATGVSLPTVRKLLKTLAGAGLVNSVRGPGGGYRLARDAAQITAADVIDALEGPVSITECSSTQIHCAHEDHCSVGSAWQQINVAIRRALDDVTLVDLLRTNNAAPRFKFGGLPITIQPMSEKDG